MTRISSILAAIPIAAILPTLSAAPAPGDFATSFEAGEAVQPIQNTVEKINGSQAFQKNVQGSAGNILLERVTAVTASADNAPGESAQRVADDDAGSKWLAFQRSAWLRYELNRGTAAAGYTLVSGNDHPERDPRDWTLSGSDDGEKWTVLDTRKNQTWGERERGVARTYPIGNARPFTHYRLDISSNQSGGITQLAEWTLNPPETAGSAATPMTTAIGAGPAGGYNMKPLAGFTGLRALKYAGQHTADGRGYAMNRLFDVNLTVGPRTRLSYHIFPELTGNDLQYPSTYVAVNLRFSDGSQLSGLKPLDAYEVSATASGQGAGKILYPNQWNHVRVDVGSIADGKTITAIQLCYDNGGATRSTKFRGWIDDLKIEATPPRIDGSSLTNYVDTRRGTNSSSAFSRGSNEAITAIPNGFNFLVPVTDATARSREYSYHQGNDDQNRTRFEGLGISHQPSPWMGDRNQFSVMPVAGSAAPAGNPHERAVTFRHDRESAQPEYYGVTLDNGVKAEMTPTNRGMIMRFTFPDDSGSIVLDSPTGDGDFSINPATGAVTGWIDHGSGFRAGQSRMFVSGTFDQVPTTTGLAAGGRPLTKFATFRAGAGKSISLRLATSLISLEQAAKNLALEVGGQGFEAIREQARATWNQRLGVIRVEGGPEAQLVTLYGCLYRLNIYPNAQFENTGTVTNPVYQYASPVSRKTGPGTPTHTGAKIVPGRMYVNNGFWDTYRTAWPAYALLYPEIAADLIDGFTDQYRDGGWIARWSSPGYANIMTGTSSDAAFADAYLRGVELPDPLSTYAAAVKNASTPSDNQDIGRKSLTTSLFLGYAPVSQGESVSWATEGYINDFGIGNMAAALAEDPAIPEALRATLREESEYYIDRSKNYVKLFDPAIGFFQARGADGKFAVPPEKFDPTKWWGPYTETNGWNFAFHAPHDPNGLANLYGGRAALEAKLDAFFSLPEKSLGPIHEEVEARDGRFGQWGVSNQVSHHIPFIYNAVGAPAKCQKIVREALQRSFTGSEIGQGYPGDEDNGEMSAWYIFNALGFYPLQVGSDRLVLGSPLFRKTTVSLGGGRTLVINAPGNSAEKIYVKSLQVNGKPHSGTWIDSEIFRTGGTLDYELAGQPSAWGTRPNDSPPSLTQGTAPARPLADTTGNASAKSQEGENLVPLFDNSSATEVVFKTAKPVVVLSYSGAKPRPTFYTLTASRTAADPSAWILEGSNDGTQWTTIDTRRDRKFANRRETVPHKIQQPGAYKMFRLSITEGAPSIALAEIELLSGESD